MDGIKEIHLCVKAYPTLPEEACFIRELVFVQEQGFTDEFDAIDLTAVHLVLFVGEEPAAVCRVYQESGKFILGRVAVRQEFRGLGLGEQIVKAAETHAATKGAGELHLHAQCRITAFYEACGYTPYGEMEDDQGCPHIWMKKEVSL